MSIYSFKTWLDLVDKVMFLALTHTNYNSIWHKCLIGWNGEGELFMSK